MPQPFDYTIKPFSPTQAMGGALQMRGQQLEQERFMEESNLRSTILGAQQYLAIPDTTIAPEIAAQMNPQEIIMAQNQDRERFLQNRVQEIQARGGDPRDTIEALAMPPEQQMQAATNLLEIGRQRDIIQPTVGKAPGTKAVLDLTTGTQTFATNAQIQADPSRYQPISRGPLVQIGGEGERETKFQEAEGKAISKEVTDLGLNISMNRKTHQNMQAIGALYKNIPEGSLLTGVPFAGLTQNIAKIGRKLGLNTEGLSETEMVDMITKKAAKESRIPGSGVYTDKDFEIDLKLQPGIEGTHQGNVFKIKYISAKAKYEIAYAKEERKVLHRTKDRSERDALMERWMTKHPYKETIQKQVFGKDFEKISTKRNLRYNPTTGLLE